MLSDEIKQDIQNAYRKFLEQKELKARYGQRLMIAEVARGLGAIDTDDNNERTGDPAVVVVEAGTGTGKTVAYSLAAIPIALRSEKRLVIATATVALQEQIVDKDLPDIIRNSGLKFTYALAKGRGRYLCLSRLDHWLDSHEQEHRQADMLAEQGYHIDINDEHKALFANMLDTLARGRWDGDRDSWPEAIEDPTWRIITTDHTQCMGRRCGNYDACSFYKAREGLEKVDVIVTNHDLVLADLALGGGMVLPHPKDTFYIFDEGHHLPDKAINHFAHSTRLHATSEWLGQLDKTVTRLHVQHPLPGEVGALLEKAPELARSLREHQQFAYATCQGIAEFAPVGNSEYEQPRHRFAGGLVPDALREQGLELKKGYMQLADVLSRMVDHLKKAMEDEGDSALDSSLAEEWFPLFGSLYSRADSNLALWSSFTAEDAAEAAPSARWLVLTDSGNDIEVNSSPILAAETLRRHLWYAAHGVLVTSATLTALGRFERFSMRAGLPASAATAAVPSPFNYAEAGLLHVPDLKVDVRDQDAHSRAIVRELPGLLDNDQSALVLFSSRKQMNDVFEGLDREWRKRVLIQGRLSRQETLQKHKSRIDAGETSVLFGLASFAEGVDLPGDYCQHVVIAKIPFAVPDDPVEAALAEWIEARGGNPFMEIAVPDASLKLIQACGRLLRNEQDTGRVTILDRRLVTQRYGKALLNALPPFRQQID
ncbi:MAG: ATP-dependent DNA helicase DinG [Thiopseudomonas sp.]|nr:ATP-dependent DNA helicase DinG [Thiopseudomonas sp.]